MRAPRLPLAILAAAGSAAAQTPTVAVRLVAVNQPGTPASLPDNQTFVAIHRQGAGRALLETNLHNIYLANGSGFQRVMVAGEQVPGQDPGVVWASRLSAAQTFDITGRGQLFHANISSPALGQNRTVTLIGDLLSGDLWAGPVGITWPAVTRTALYAPQGSNPALQLGHVETGLETIIPAGATVPGSPDPVSTWRSAATNADGGMTASAYGAANTLINQFAIADGVITPLARSGSTFQTDRGAVTAASTPSLDTQLLADGSIPMSGSLTFPDGLTRRALWLFRPGQTSSIIAVEGEHAPGTPPSFTTLFPNARTATRGGKVLWYTALRDNGAAAGEAYFLWSGGRSRLILRSRTPAPGNAAGQDVPTLDSGPSGVLQLNEAGDAALASSPGGSPAYLYLYSPDAGTVEAARADLPLPGSVLSGTISQLTPFYGTSNGSWRTAGDDTGAPLLDQGGELFLAGTVRPGISFGAFFSITAPGCRADYTQDGFLDFFDYIAFLDCFEGGACPLGKDADFNNDDFADFFDYADFIDAFERGC